jgi:predicted amidophosphoribosyltransferase
LPLGMAQILTLQAQDRDDTEHNEQKSLGLASRWQRKLSLGPSGRPPAGVYVFVDDVLTSGATATAAWRALGSPKAFLAIVCFVRARASQP